MAAAVRRIRLAVSRWDPHWGFSSSFLGDEPLICFHASSRNVTSAVAGSARFLYLGIDATNEEIGNLLLPFPRRRPIRIESGRRNFSRHYRATLKLTRWYISYVIMRMANAHNKQPVPPWSHYPLATAVTWLGRQYRFASVWRSHCQLNYPACAVTSVDRGQAIWKKETIGHTPMLSRLRLMMLFGSVDPFKWPKMAKKRRHLATTTATKKGCGSSRFIG